jgi:hypothetical protein
VTDGCYQIVIIKVRNKKLSNLLDDNYGTVATALIGLSLYPTATRSSATLRGFESGPACQGRKFDWRAKVEDAGLRYLADLHNRRTPPIERPHRKADQTNSQTSLSSNQPYKERCWNLESGVGPDAWQHYITTVAEENSSDTLLYQLNAPLVSTLATRGHPATQTIRLLETAGQVPESTLGENKAAAYWLGRVSPTYRWLGPEMRRF